MSHAKCLLSGQFGKEVSLKDESVRTLERQWAMLRSIPRAPRRISATELSVVLDELGFSVTKRTIERDLQNLATRFPLYLDDRSKPYGWSWMKDANFEFMPRLSVSQSVALLLAKLHLQKLLPISMHKDLQPLFDMAENEVAITGWKDWHRRTAVVPTSLSLIPPKFDAAILSTVQSALARRRRIEGMYRTKGSESAKSRQINPLGLLSRGPVIYLVCTLYDYSDIVHLAIHRLTNVKELPDDAIDPPGFDFVSHAKLAGSRFLSRGPIKLEVKMDRPAAEHLLETPLSKDQAWTALNDGEHVLIEATVEDDETLRWWLLGFADQLEVLQPDDLREFMRESTRHMAALYTMQ